MRKILTGLMALILVVLFSATYYCSSKTEEVFRAQIEQLNQSYSGLLQVELLDYQRGLLVSEVKTLVTVRQDSLPLQHQIRHFPWKVRLMTSLAEGSPVADKIAELIPLDKLQLQTDVDLSGVSQSHFALPDLTFSDSDGELRVSGLHFDCNLDGRLRGGDIQFELNALTVVHPGEAELALSGVELSSTFAEQQELMLGGGGVSIGHLSFKQEKKPGFELNGLHYQANSSLTADQLASDLDLQLDSVTLADETFTEGRLLLKMTGIDAAALREVQATAKQIQAEMLGQQVDPVIMQLQMLGLYSQLFKDGLTLTLDQLSLQADKGGFLGKGYLTLQELNFTGGSPVALDKLNGQFQLDVDRSAFVAGFRLLEKLQRQGRASNPAVVAEQAEQLAGGLVQKGIFARQDDGYRIDFSVEQGQGVLNGNAFKL